jgi:hypothetical protein
LGNDLKYLVEEAKKARMTPAEKEQQRRSFAYGNTHIENSDITRKTVDDAAELLRRQKQQK